MSSRVLWGSTGALTLSAVFRAMDLIGTSVAGLPLQTLDAGDDGTQVPVGSFLDNPAGPDRATPFEWAELVTWHLGLQGNAFLQHVYNRGGAICGLNPIHPLCVSVDEDLDLPGGMEMSARAKSNKLGLSIRIVKGFDIRLNKQLTRLDVLFGAKQMYGDFACRVCS